jgi:hypothetical protein
MMNSELAASTVFSEVVRDAAQALADVIYAPMMRRGRMARQMRHDLASRPRRRDVSPEAAARLEWRRAHGGF